MMALAGLLHLHHRPLLADRSLPATTSPPTGNAWAGAQPSASSTASARPNLITLLPAHFTQHLLVMLKTDSIHRAGKARHCLKVQAQMAPQLAPPGAQPHIRQTGTAAAAFVGEIAPQPCFSQR